MHLQQGQRYGVDINYCDICDTYSNHVYDPVVVKVHALQAATEAACLILSIDETIR